MTIFLGIDAGGSGARSAVMDAEGVIVATLETGSIHAGQPVEDTASALAQLIQAVRTKLDGRPLAGIVAGLAGAGDMIVRRQLCAAVKTRTVETPVHVVSDVETAAASSYAGTRIVVVQVGTGSFAVAVGDDGRLHRIGGRGWLLGDEGSAFDVVRRAATAAVRAFDGLAEQTALVEVLTGHFKPEGMERLGAVLQNMAPGQVAAALPLVLATAGAGDRVAAGLVRKAGQQLAELAGRAARCAGFGIQDVQVVLGGGAMSEGSVLRQSLTDALRAEGVLHPAHPTYAPAVGAARLASAVFMNRRPMATWCVDG